jgi:hypothetical protein
MKKTLTGVVTLLAGAFVAHSQGTVSLGNYAALSTYIYVTYKGTAVGGAGGATTGTPAGDIGNGNDWTVALYGNVGSGDDPSTLTECLAAGGGFATATLANGSAADALAGTWYSTVVADIPGTTLANQAATVQLYAWYNDGGTITSYAAAVLGGDPYGASLTGNVTTGGPQAVGPPVIQPPLPAGLGNIALSVPEPSTIALGVMGASAFLLRLRRKN